MSIQRIKTSRQRHATGARSTARGLRNPSAIGSSSSRIIRDEKSSLASLASAKRRTFVCPHCGESVTELKRHIKKAHTKRAKAQKRKKIKTALSQPKAKPRPHPPSKPRHIDSQEQFILFWNESETIKDVSNRLYEHCGTWHSKAKMLSRAAECRKLGKILKRMNEEYWMPSIHENGVLSKTLP